MLSQKGLNGKIYPAELLLAKLKTLPFLLSVTLVFLSSILIPFGVGNFTTW